MNYILCNFYITGNKLLEQKFTNEIFKSTGYNAKISNKKTNKTSFNYVMIPMEYYVPEEDLPVIKSFMTGKLVNKEKDNLALYSVYKFLTFFDKNISGFTFETIAQVDDTKMDIFYSDGSSTKSGSAAYGTVKLLGESSDESAVFDIVSGKNQKYKSFSEKIDVGTNNIGELTGVYTAVKNRGDNMLQVIVSDSEYSLKCFREWIHTWKQNKYLGSNKKQILNCQLIKNIQQEIEKSGKIYIFQWTKGHAKTQLNEICDRLAKGELNI